MEYSLLANLLLGGLVSFLFYKIKQFDGKRYLTEAEIKILIKEQVDPIKDEFDKLEVKIDSANSQLVEIAITLGRIDERMKRDNQ